jgi:hypothetical protein
MTLRILTAGALAFGLLCAGAATAQPAADPLQACAPDFQKFCPDAKPGPTGGRRECIRAHVSELSDACKQAIAAFRATHPQAN